MKRIEKMQSTHLDMILSIEQVLFSNPWSREMFVEEIDHHESYVLEEEENNKICGYICGWRVLDEYHITNLAIIPEFQGQGWGTKLVSFIIAEMKTAGCRDFFLEVRQNNSRALKMYQNLGFQIIGTREKYYTNPVEDAVVMKFRVRFG